MSKLEKIGRHELVDFLDVAPNSDTPDWAIIGYGITDKSTDYGAQANTEKFIIHKNSTTTIDGYEMSSGVEQSCYKGDPEFEFIDDLRYRLGTGAECDTHLLEVDKYKYSESGGTIKYRAAMFDATIELTSRGGDTAKINYTIHYQGDPVLETVTFTGGKPVFTANDTIDTNNINTNSESNEETDNLN